MNPHGKIPHVGIILLNWNRPDFTIACLESLEQLDYPSYEVIVVDNGSVDGSPALIRQRFPNITLIENGQNLGFAAGNNVGIWHLMHRGANYVLLLNNDTEVAPNMVRVLVEFAESDPRIGIVGPKIYYYSKPDIVWSAGGAVTKYGQPSHIGIDESDKGAPDVARDVAYVTGCAMLVKRQVIEEVGALDERFFIYFEETEWCARTRHAGYRVAYVPEARMWHKIEQTERNYSRRYLYMMARNRLLYLRCSGASNWIILRAILDVLRTATSWSLRPRYRDMRPFSGALLRGVGHFALGRFGAPPAGI